MLIVRKGPTSHLPLHDDDDDDTIEIPPTEILDRIFMSQQPKISKGTRVVVKGSNARFGRVVESHTTQANT